MKITKEQILAAADAIHATEGRMPTVKAVRDALGAGSYTTINDVMREWREGQKPEKVSPEIIAPQAVIDYCGTLGNDIWRIALQMVKESLAAEREELEAIKVEMDEQQQEIAKHADELTDEIGKLRETVDDVTFSYEQEKVAHQGTRELLKLEQDELLDVRSKYEVASARLNDLTEERERLIQAVDRANESQDKIKGEKAEGDREVTRLKGLVEALEQKADQLRGSVQAHMEEREKVQASERKASEESQAAKIEAAQLRGEVDSLQKQLAQQAELFKQLTVNMTAIAPPKSKKTEQGAE